MRPTEFEADPSYYSSSVSEKLSYDAYSRYEALVDDYSDVAHFLMMGAPLRVATAPDPSPTVRSEEYECWRCGRVVGFHKQKRSECKDCEIVEREAGPVPVETPEQRRQRLDPVSPVDFEAARLACIQDLAKRQQSRLIRQYVAKLADKRLRAAVVAQPPPRPPKPPRTVKTRPVTPKAFRANTEKDRAEREARFIEKQAAAERQFLADLEASNATWMLGKRPG